VGLVRTLLPPKRDRQKGQKLRWSKHQYLEVEMFDRHKAKKAEEDATAHHRRSDGCLSDA
jgi:hypothetical protein